MKALSLTLYVSLFSKEYGIADTRMNYHNVIPLTPKYPPRCLTKEKTSFFKWMNLWMRHSQSLWAQNWSPMHFIRLEMESLVQALCKCIWVCGFSRHCIPFNISAEGLPVSMGVSLCARCRKKCVAGWGFERLFWASFLKVFVLYFSSIVP